MVHFKHTHTHTQTILSYNPYQDCLEVHSHSQTHTWKHLRTYPPAWDCCKTKEAVQTFSAFFHSEGGKLFSGAIAVSKQCSRHFYFISTARSKLCCAVTYSVCREQWKTVRKTRWLINKLFFL